MTTVKLGGRPNPFHVGNRGELVLSIVEGNPLGDARAKRVADIATLFAFRPAEFTTKPSPPKGREEGKGAISWLSQKKDATVQQQ